MSVSLDITIIILSYNTYDLTLQCLTALSKTDWGSLTHEIILVDNASTDKTVERIKKKFSDVRVIKNSKNIGFAAGNNVGIREAKGRYLLLLNSDTEVNPGTLKTMIEFMDTHTEAGASTCRLVLPDGSMDPACHRGFPTPWNGFSYYVKLESVFPKTKLFGGYHMGYKDIAVPHEVDAISGAFFMVRKEVIQEVGMLDEAYFMYAEDIDWAYRIKEHGWEIWFNPDTAALHHKKKSGRGHSDQKKRIESYIYFLIYNKLFYTKHYEKKYSPFITFLVYSMYDVQVWLAKTFGIAL